jgi:hypothetical protein
MEDPEGVIVLEWAERLGAFAIPGAYLVKIADLGMEARVLSIVLNQ